MAEAQSSGLPDGWEVVQTPSRASASAPQGTSAGLALAAAGKAVPAIAQGAAEVATNPAIPRMAAAAGQFAGGGAELLKGNILGVGPGAWAGGKGGWFTGKLAQKVAGPVATAMEKVAPYAQTLSTLAVAQGVNDLAQMAEPNRQDIGFLGVGRTAAIAPALSAESLQDDLKSMRALMAGGKTEMQALKEVAAGNPQKWGRLMTLYIQSRQVK